MAYSGGGEVMVRYLSPLVWPWTLKIFLQCFCKLRFATETSDCVPKASSDCPCFLHVKNCVKMLLNLSFRWQKFFWFRSCWRSSKMVPFDRPYDFLLVHHCKYSYILYRFWVIWRWMISWPSNLDYITRGHSDWYHSKAWVRFPIAFHCRVLSLSDCRYSTVLIHSVKPELTE